MDELKQHADPDIVIMLVGNKLDLVESNPSVRRVGTENGRKFAQQHGLLFSETSAIGNINVKDAFENLLQEIYNEKSKEGVHEGGKNGHVKLTPKANGGPQSSAGCC